MSRSRWSALAAGLSVGVLVLASCSSEPEEPEVIRIGAFNFPESKLIGEMYAQALEEAGYGVTRNLDIAEREDYLVTGNPENIDMLPEYLGSFTETLNILWNGPDPEEDAATANTEETLDNLKELLKDNGYDDGELSDPSPAQNTNAFAVTQSFAEENDLETLSDLAAMGEPITLGAAVDCAENPYCKPGLEETYGLEITEVVELDFGGPKVKNALMEGEVDLGLVLSTDSELDKDDLVVLEDDKELEVAQNVIAVVDELVATDSVMDALNQIHAALTTTTLRELNGQVADGLPTKYVAGAWLASQGLLAEAPPSPSPTPTPTPTPTPEPQAQPDSGGGGGGAPPSTPNASWKNRGEPSSAAKSQNWPGLAQCESGGNPTIVSANGLYHGLYQFSTPTWQSMGGSGVASDKSSDEQTYRAQLLWDAAGPGQWPHCQIYL